MRVATHTAAANSAPIEANLRACAYNQRAMRVNNPEIKQTLEVADDQCVMNNKYTITIDNAWFTNSKQNSVKGHARSTACRKNNTSTQFMKRKFAKEADAASTYMERHVNHAQ